ncbi:MAG: methyltransferase domain-containing protein [Hyphomicrobiaceae bacterium]
MTGFDAIAYKKTTLGQWEAVADRWNAWGSLLDAWLGPVSETLLDMAKVTAGSRVLHVAGGSGQEALQSARRVGPAGFVLTTDLSEALTALAAANLEAAGYRNARAQVMDGEQFSLSGDPFDAVLSRVGLIYFPDQLGAVEHQVAALRPGGHIGAIVYATAEECRFFSDPVGVIRRHAALPPPAPGQPGPFSLGSPGRIEALFEAAGLVDVEVRRINAPVILPTAADCLRFEQESFGALHQMLGKLDEAGKARAWAEVGEKLKAFETSGRFEGPCVMIAAVGRTPN